jgi:hypothetical protein
MLAMGFTGKKAMRFKEDYIRRFNEMEQYIKSLHTARLEHPQLTDAIKHSHEAPKPYHFSNEANMINQIVLGVNAKGFREANGITKGKSIRPYLSADQIKAVEKLQRADIGLIMADLEYDERKAILEKYNRACSVKRITGEAKASNE